MSRIWPACSSVWGPTRPARSCDRHGPKLGVPPRPRPPIVREAVEEAADLLVLGGDHPHQVLEGLPPREVFLAERLLVVVGEDRVPLEQQPADPKAVDHDHDVPHVDERLPGRPLPGAGRPVLLARRHAGDGRGQDGGRGADVSEDGAMFGTHG